VLKVSSTVATCYRHPDRETGIRCQRCERPVCPDCMIPAPVGVQCAECVRASPSRIVSGRALLLGHRPYLTYTLIAFNVAVWAAGAALGVLSSGSNALLGGGPLVVLGGLSGPRVASGEWWRILTSAFLHTGLIHLALNMAALYVFGTPLERALGGVRFALLYLASLAAGSFGVLLLSPHSLTVGASGAIFGLLGAILVGQRAAGISFRNSGILSLLVINLAFTFAVPGISIGGHLGGLAGGLAAGSLLFRWRVPGGTLVPALACLTLAAGLFLAALWVGAHPLRA
jgi:membrane associated rhomboid family serine protease